VRRNGLHSLRLRSDIFVRPLFRMQNVRDPYPVIQDVELRRPDGRTVGFLRRGTVVFPPCMHDLAVTDPGDLGLRKVYVRISREGWEKAIGKFRDISPDEVDNSPEMYTDDEPGRIFRPEISDYRAEPFNSGEKSDVLCDYPHLTAQPSPH